MRIVLSGAIRNCAHYLERIFDEISNNYIIFEDFRYIFVESDSVDGSDALLDRFHKNAPVGEIRLLGNLRQQMPLRTDRIACAREMCLDFVRELRWNGPNDYFVVLDCDDVSAGFSLLSIKTAIEKAKFEWDALFANQENRPYYDIFALRHHIWCPSDCWKEVRERPLFMSKKDAINLFVHGRQIRISSSADPILVESAFGGLGIYRTSSLVDASYRSQEKQKHAFCEHVTMHEGMRKRGFDKLYIYPQLLLKSVSEQKDERQSSNSYYRNLAAKFRSQVISSCRALSALARR